MRHSRHPGQKAREVLNRRLELALKEPIEMPGVTQHPSASANTFGVVSTELVAPGADRLVGHGHATFRHQFFDIAVADRKSEIQPYAIADDLSREPVAMVG